MGGIVEESPGVCSPEGGGAYGVQRWQGGQVREAGSCLQTRVSTEVPCTGRTPMSTHERAIKMTRDGQQREGSKREICSIRSKATLRPEFRDISISFRTLC